MSRFAAENTTFDPVHLDPLQEAAADVIAAQPAIQRRKNTIAAAVQALAQVLNAVAVVAAGYDPKIGAVVAGLIFVAEIVFHATTTGPVTPAGAQKIVDKAHEQSARNAAVTPPTYDGEPAPMPR